jgi:hypothetical protein
MFDRLRLIKFGTFLMVTAMIALVLVPAAMAQDEPAPEDQPTITETAPQPAPPPKPAADAGPFSKGKVRVGFYAGAGNTYSQTYAIIGAGVGYYLMNGFEIGIDGEGWVLNDPTIWKVTPQIRYVLWKMNPIRPYVGAFWRKTFVSDNYPDYDSWGARGGVAYRKGGNYLAVGAVYEKFNDYTGTGKDYTVYPEIALWISF